METTDDAYACKVCSVTYDEYEECYIQWEKHEDD